MRNTFNLGATADIKKEEVIKSDILPQITLSDVKAAVKHAHNIVNQKLPGDAVSIRHIKCYHNPDFSIHRFIEYVFKECGEPVSCT